MRLWPVPEKNSEYLGCPDFFYNHQIPLPKVPIGQEVDIHLVPDLKHSSLDLRLWSNNHFIDSITFPLSDFPRVHF